MCFWSSVKRYGIRGNLPNYKNATFEDSIMKKCGVACSESDVRLVERHALYCMVE